MKICQHCEISEAEFYCLGCNKDVCSDCLYADDLCPACYNASQRRATLDEAIKRIGIRDAEERMGSFWTKGFAEGIEAVMVILTKMRDE